jgi:NAD(P)-dependent dehydrogenase (short-subunit alcohol dehydrogenase family)
MSVTGKVIVITGSTRGIGRAVAEECARRGATVVVSSRTTAAVDAAVGALAATGAAVSGFAANAGHYEELVALRDHALTAHGRIDVWFGNAGLSNGYRYLEDESPQEIHDLITANVLGQLYGAKVILPHFREHGGYFMTMCGRGWKGGATPYTTAYAASKAAVASLTRSLAAENKKHGNVSVNGFVPGMVATDFYADDIATSERLESTKGNIALALDAFGVPIDEVSRRAADLLGEEPGKTTGKIYALLSPGRMMRGGAKMAWWGMTGKMARD